MKECFLLYVWLIKTFPSNTMILSILDSGKTGKEKNYKKHMSGNRLGGRREGGRRRDGENNTHFNWRAITAVCDL